ncbi:phosphomannomutase/phosphoglucomutase [Leeia sp. TBRC 13508]|uniref:Phosphomannomutase/phosphoglucomutase n=1 Tax=Leeia speluncae TaxID=2884804 RepID=A0ABS8D2I4_9NEIS|nr:phosphomannomutase/phosphoglucomutase [Leeia speluncae]MCB6182402.1 phosphomannomutase/phosphoglucomutase [Leeia speluncae]
MTTLAREIFKAYDIRGIVGKNLTEEVVELVGQSIGTEAVEKGVKAIVIGRDGRHSGPAFAKALAKGIQSTGTNVIDVGCVATPMTYFAAHHLKTYSAVMITGSHNPPDYNGLKMMLAGETLAGERIQALYERIVNKGFVTGNGSYETTSITDAYLDNIVGHIQLKRPLNIIVDAGNGVAGAFAPTLFKRLGCTVTEMFCEVDGNFPNHHPDPAKPENLVDLKNALANSDAELGLAFDGDGDRLGVVTKSGEIIYPDRQMMLFAADILERNPGSEIIFDVKSSGLLGKWIKDHGGKPLMWRTGHSFMKAKLKETGAPLAGEMSGHIFFKERWFGFDDGIYAGARLLEILSAHANPTEILNNLPQCPSTPELHIDCKAEGEQHALIAKLLEVADFPEAVETISIDGLRIEFEDGFGLARASNTTPVVVIRFEGHTEAALQRIQARFKEELLKVDNSLTLNF